MLKTLRLHNFRTYLNAELAFTPYHLLIGRNNSGKTNLCAALQFLGATATHDLSVAVQAVPGGAGEIKNRVLDSNTIEISCTCDLVFEGTPYLYSYELKLDIETSSTPPHGSQLVLRVAREQLTVKAAGWNNVTLLWSDGHEAQMLHEEDFVRRTETRVKTLAPRDATMLSKLYEVETNRRAVLFRRYLKTWSLFALSPDRMRYGWVNSKEAYTGLDSRGGNLAVALYQLKNYNERRYRSTIEHVRLIEPELDAVNFIVSPGQAPTPFVELGDKYRASWVGLSDGTLRCLGLAYIAEAVRLYEEDFSDALCPLIIVEEPENGIFPGQLRAFFDKFQERASAGQFLFTSHSPYFINFFDGDRESVTILRRNNERTEITPPPPPDDDDRERPLLAEQYSMELFD